MRFSLHIGGIVKQRCYPLTDGPACKNEDSQGNCPFRVCGVEDSRAGGGGGNGRERGDPDCTIGTGRTLATDMTEIKRRNFTTRQQKRAGQIQWGDFLPKRWPHVKVAHSEERERRAVRSIQNSTQQREWTVYRHVKEKGYQGSP